MCKFGRSQTNGSKAVRKAKTVELKDGQTEAVKTEKAPIPPLNESNPIGELLEVTQKFSLTPPVYEFENVDGPAHSRVYACHVKFSEFKETGYGKSKKHAKRQAAERVLDKLRTVTTLNQDLDTNGNGGVTGSDGKSKRFRGKKSSLFNSFTKLKLSTKPCVNKLLEYTGSIDALNKKYLECLTQEEDLNFKFIAIANKYADGDYDYYSYN